MPRDAWETVQRLEKRLYLRNQLLRDADWAAMASSLELRVPMIDLRLWRAVETRMADRRARPRKSDVVRATATAARPGLPDELWERPKSGFSVPVADWMLPPRAGDRDTAGQGSRRIAIRLLDEWGVR
jgi:asparagine synthase (glutamine-hydrolysing)